MKKSLFARYFTITIFLIIAFLAGYSINNYFKLTPRQIEDIEWGNWFAALGTVFAVFVAIYQNKIQSKNHILGISKQREFLEMQFGYSKSIAAFDIIKKQGDEMSDYCLKNRHSEDREILREMLLLLTNFVTLSTKFHRIITNKDVTELLVSYCASITSSQAMLSILFPGYIDSKFSKIYKNMYKNAESTEKKHLENKIKFTILCHAKSTINYQDILVKIISDYAKSLPHDMRKSLIDAGGDKEWFKD